MDTWFTQQPLIQAIVEQGLDVIGMVKATNQRYLVGGRAVSLKELYRLSNPVQGKKGILRSIHTVMANGIPVKVVFIQNRNKKNEWVAILSTDCTLTEQEIVRIYGIRWDIEVFFKTTKSLLRLQEEFQGRSFDLLISHTNIVFTRYIVLSWQNQCNTDDRTIGGLFYELCDEINELDWAVALQQLIELLQDTLKKINKMTKKSLKVNYSNGLQAFLVISRLICQFLSAKVELVIKIKSKIKEKMDMTITSNYLHSPALKTVQGNVVKILYSENVYQSIFPVAYISAQYQLITRVFEPIT